MTARYPPGGNRAACRTRLAAAQLARCSRFQQPRRLLTTALRAFPKLGRVAVLGTESGGARASLTFRPRSNSARITALPAGLEFTSPLPSRQGVFDVKHLRRGDCHGKLSENLAGERETGHRPQYCNAPSMERLTIKGLLWDRDSTPRTSHTRLPLPRSGDAGVSRETAEERGVTR